MNGNEEAMDIGNDNDIVTVDLFKFVINRMGVDIYKLTYMLYGFIGTQILIDILIVLKLMGVF